MYVLFLFFVEPDFGCGFSAGVLGSIVLVGSCVSPDALVAKLLVWCPCCVFLGLSVTVAYMHVFVTGRAGMCLKK